MALFARWSIVPLHSCCIQHDATAARAHFRAEFDLSFYSSKQIRIWRLCDRFRTWFMTLLPSWIQIEMFAACKTVLLLLVYSQGASIYDVRTGLKIPQFCGQTEHKIRTKGWFGPSSSAFLDLSEFKLLIPTAPFFLPTGSSGRLQWNCVCLWANRMRQVFHDARCAKAGIPEGCHPQIIWAYLRDDRLKREHEVFGACFLPRNLQRGN